MIHRWSSKYNKVLSVKHKMKTAKKTYGSRVDEEGTGGGRVSRGSEVRSTGVTSTWSTTGAPCVQGFAVVAALGQGASASLASALRKSVTTAPVENNSSGRSCKSRVLFCHAWLRLAEAAAVVSFPPCGLAAFLTRHFGRCSCSVLHRGRSSSRINTGHAAIRPSNRRYTFTGYLDLDLTPTPLVLRVDPFCWHGPTQSL